MSVKSNATGSDSVNFRSACRLRVKHWVFSAVFVSLLAGCAQGPKPLYNWQSYQTQVYTYLKDADSNYAVQAQALEQNIETARSSDQSLPPGFHAHLGMLYLKLGTGEKAIEQFQMEKLRFPESTAFMDFLLRNAHTGDGSKMQNQAEQGEEPARVSVSLESAKEKGK